MKFLNLVLYSVNNYYIQMRDIVDEYYSKLTNVKTVYYTCNPNMTNDYLLDGNILYIKEEDTYIEGILRKTIKSFEYFLPDIDEYDYIIRSNISSIIDFKLLEKELLHKPINMYGGGKIWELEWLDSNCGVIDDTWFGTKYASGTSIILSKNGLKFLVDNKQKLHYDIIDDLSIGILFREYMNDYKPIGFDDKWINVMTSDKLDNDKYIFYRHKSLNRQVDIKIMKEVIYYLLYK